MLSMLAIAALAGFATAQEVLYTFEFWSEAECKGDSFGIDFFKHSGTSCRQGTYSPDPEKFKYVDDHWVAYTTAKDLAKNCKVALLESNIVEPDACGDVIGWFSGATNVACVELTLPQDLGAIWCCDDECDNVEASVAARRLARGDTSPAPKSKVAKKTDVAAVKRAPLMRPRAECTWEGSKPVDDRGVAVKLAATLACPADHDGDCTAASTEEIGFEASETFGITAEAGVNFFEVVQASVSFTQEYTYTESEKRSITYSIGYPKGAKGYLTFTPFRECTDGKFTGECADWAVEEDGRVCVPKTLAGGQPDGEYKFVRVFN